MNVSLPKDQKAFVDRRVEAGGFGSVSDYVRELIRRDQRERTREEVEQRLLSALESPRDELSREDWAKLKEEVHTRAEARRLLLADQLAQERAAVERRLLDRLDEPSTPLTAGDWDDMRAEVRRKLAAKNKTR